MQITRRYTLTKWLVLISIIGSLASVLTIYYQQGELYPFFTWKLYSQPLGTAGTFTEYRIYAQGSNDTIFTRRPIKATHTFTPDEYVYTFNFLVGKTLTHSTETTTYKRKLLAFVKHVEPGANRYKIIAESYNPKDLLTAATKYDTTTVITF